MKVWEKILQFLEDNSEEKYRTIQLAELLNLSKYSIRRNLSVLKAKSLIDLEHVGKNVFYRINIEELNKYRLKIKEETEKRKEKRIFLPKQIRDQLNWEEANQVQFIEKDEKIYFKTKKNI